MNKNISKYIISKYKKVEDALKIIDRNGEKTCFIVDEKKRLVGSLTDGDIRRALLKHNNTNLKCSEIANRNCKYVDQLTDSKTIRSLAQTYGVIPIVDETKKLTDC